LDQLNKELSPRKESPTKSANNLFQSWKDYEKQRRINFARVMKERRRLKALKDSPVSLSPVPPP